MDYLRHYYVTLCNEYYGKYVEIYALNKDIAFDSVVAKYGVLNVSNVYTERAWQDKYTQCFSRLGVVGTKKRKVL